MTREESRAVTFVAVLLLLAVVARFVSRPKPILITAGPVDVAALRAAGEAMAERPGKSNRKRRNGNGNGNGNGKRGRTGVVTAPPAPAAPPTWTEPAWRRPHRGPVYIIEDESPVSATGPLNLNRASAHEIDALPGVAPTVAQRIVARRDSIGRFEKLEDLDPVRGVGPALLQKLKGKVSFR